MGRCAGRLCRLGSRAGRRAHLDGRRRTGRCRPGRTSPHHDDDSRNRDHIARDNNNGVAFQAARHASRIRALGYEATSGNWSNFGVAQTFITVLEAERSHAENLVLRILGEAEVRSGAGFSVVLGADDERVNS